MDSKIPKIRVPVGRESKGVAYLEPRLWDLFIQDEGSGTYLTRMSLTVGVSAGQSDASIV